MPAQDNPARLEFEINNVYKRSSLHDRFGGQRMGGISTPKRAPIVVIFSGSTGSQFGYKDGWKDDVFEYTGEGQKGDMIFKGGNKAIRDHQLNGKSLHLFEQAGPGKVKYAGELVYAGHHRREAPDINGVPRSAIVFELRRKASWTKSHIEEDAKDAGFQQEVLYEPPADLAPGPVPPPAPSKEKGSVAYTRKPGIAKKRIVDAGYKCEVDPEHSTFISRATGKPYIEAHHLIPVSKQADFTKGSLDVPENILALCPLCHRKFHHSNFEPQLELISRFLAERRDLLSGRGIEISIEKLREYYAE